MKKERKNEVVSELTEKIGKNINFYIADVSDLTVKQTVELRKLCFKNGIELRVSKNTMIVKALQNLNINNQELIGALKGPSSLMFCENVNTPAKIIKEFRKTNQKPLLKAAYIEESVYVGDNQLEALIALKSKEQLIADVVALLNSPIRNLISALNSGGQKIMGVLETMSKKEN